MVRPYTGKRRSKSTLVIVREARALRATGLKLREIAAELARLHPEIAPVSICAASYWSRGLIDAGKKFAIPRPMTDAALRQALVEVAIGNLPARGTGRRNALEGVVRRAREAK